MSQPNSEKITLVGAGLVGALLSIFLARRGYKVQILERRQDMRKHAISAGRSINLAISTRGITALEKLGLAGEIMQYAIPMKGRMVHALDGSTNLQPYGRNDSEYINSISRATLNKSLMTCAEETGLVDILFEQRVVGMNFDTGAVAVADESGGNTRSIESDIVIGTDGSASAIRSAMMKMPGCSSREEQLDYGYKELLIQPKDGGGFRMEPNALHIWPRGTFMLIALPNFEGSFTCTLFLPFVGENSFEHLQTPADVEAFFNKYFPDAVPLLDDLTGTFFKNPTGHMVTVKCDPWYHKGRALLMGDAAHGIVPFFGQGMNCGFEDCTVLDQCMEAGGPNLAWEPLFREFFQRRKNNSDAIADMAVENFVEMRDKVADPKFLMEKSVEKILQKEFPDKYFSRYSLVTFSNVPYRLAYDAGAVENEILAELCARIATPEEVDLKRAGQLIDEKLWPLLKAHSNELCLSGAH